MNEENMKTGHEVGGQQQGKGEETRSNKWLAHPRSTCQIHLQYLRGLFYLFIYSYNYIN